MRSGAQGLEPTSWFVAVLFTATDVSYLDRFYATRTCQAFIRDPVAQRDVMRGEVSGTSLVNIYVATGVGALSPVAACAKPLVYVPNSRSETVTVIDPTTHTVLRRFSTGRLPQHVVPSYDKSRLWL